MFQRLFSILSFGCHHRRMSKPFSAARAQAAGSSSQWERAGKVASSGHYVVCLDCGRQFAYDWSQMRVVK